MFAKIAGRQMYLWRAVDSEDEILDMLVQVESGQFEPVTGVPFPPELGILIWILQLARTPDVPVPDAP